MLKSDIAVKVSISLMNTFVEMRHFIANNAALFERISKVELKQLEADKKYDCFLILDGRIVYHIGASLKDAGRKFFGVTLMKDAGSELMKRLAKT